MQTLTIRKAIQTLQSLQEARAWKALGAAAKLYQQQDVLTGSALKHLAVHQMAHTWHMLQAYAHQVMC